MSLNSIINQEKQTPRISIPNLLDSPDFFVCKRFNCIMSKISCVKRQQKSQQLKASSHSLFSATNVKETHLSLEYCSNCSQGKQIKKELKKKAKPKIKEVTNGRS